MVAASQLAQILLAGNLQHALRREGDGRQDEFRGGIDCTSAAAVIMPVAGT